MPAFDSLVGTKNLEMLWYKQSPHGLVELRKVFKETGYRAMERKITYAIKRSEWEKAKREGRSIEAWFNLILFDWPVGYGLYHTELCRSFWCLFSCLLFHTPMPFNRRRNRIRKPVCGGHGRRIGRDHQLKMRSRSSSPYPCRSHSCMGCTSVCCRRFILAGGISMSATGSIVFSREGT